MIEDLTLMELAKDAAPVALCLQRNSLPIDWRDNPPEEVIYVPEDLFLACAPAFVRSIDGEAYYDTTVLSEVLLPRLESDLQLASVGGDDSVRTAAARLLKFVTKGKDRGVTHYLAFEGP